MRKIISLAIAASTFLTTAAMADVTDLGGLKGNINEETTFPNTAMNVEVYAPGKGYADLKTASAAEYKDILIFRKVVNTDADGVLDVNFEVGSSNPASGIYSVYIAGADYKKEDRVLLTDETTAAPIIAQINSAMAGEAQNAINTIAGLIETAPFDLYISADSYLTQDVYPIAAGLAYNYMKTNNITLTSANCGTIMNKAVCVAALQKNLVSNVIADEKGFNLSQSEIAPYYKKYYVTEETGKKMAARLGGKAYATLGDFDNALTEAFVLSVLENPDGSDNTKELLNAFYAKIGITQNGTAAQYAGVSNKSYTDFAALKAAYVALAGQTQYTPQGGGGGGGVGGSGSSLNAGFTVPSQPTQYPITIFDDLDSVSWAEEAIVYLAENLIVSGKGDMKFCPNDEITREEFVKILVGALKVAPEEEKEITFSDVSADAWYYDAVKKAYSAGIVSGKSIELFGTGERITRQEMAAMVMNGAKYSGRSLEDAVSDFKFDDDGEMADWAKESVYILREAGIISGVDEYHFAPIQTATRAQAAKMIYGLLEG